MNKSSIINLYHQLIAFPGVGNSRLVITGKSALVMHGLLDSCDRLELFACSSSLSALTTHAGVKKDITIFGLEYNHELLGQPIYLRREPRQQEIDTYIPEPIDNCWVVSKFSMTFVSINNLGEYRDLLNRYASDVPKIDRIKARISCEHWIIGALIASSADLKKPVSA